MAVRFTRQKSCFANSRKLEDTNIQQQLKNLLSYYKGQFSEQFKTKSYDSGISCDYLLLISIVRLLTTLSGWLILIIPESLVGLCNDHEIQHRLAHL